MTQHECSHAAPTDSPVYSQVPINLFHSKPHTANPSPKHLRSLPAPYLVHYIGVKTVGPALKTGHHMSNKQPFGIQPFQNEHSDKQ